MRRKAASAGGIRYILHAPQCGLRRRDTLEAGFNAGEVGARRRQNQPSGGGQSGEASGNRREAGIDMPRLQTEIDHDHGWLAARLRQAGPVGDRGMMCRAVPLHHSLSYGPEPLQFAARGAAAGFARAWRARGFVQMRP